MKIKLVVQKIQNNARAFLVNAEPVIKLVNVDEKGKVLSDADAKKKNGKMHSFAQKNIRVTERISLSFEAKEGEKLPFKEGDILTLTLSK